MKAITAFDAENIEISPADMVAKTDLTRATARRMPLTRPISPDSLDHEFPGQSRSPPTGEAERLPGDAPDTFSLTMPYTYLRHTLPLLASRLLCCADRAEVNGEWVSFQLPQ